MDENDLIKVYASVNNEPEVKVVYKKMYKQLVLDGVVEKRLLDEYRCICKKYMSIELKKYS